MKYSIQRQPRRRPHAHIHTGTRMRCVCALGRKCAASTNRKHNAHKKQSLPLHTHAHTHHSSAKYFCFTNDWFPLSRAFFDCACLAARVRARHWEARGCCGVLPRRRRRRWVVADGGRTIEGHAYGWRICWRTLVCHTGHTHTHERVRTQTLNPLTRALYIFTVLCCAHFPSAHRRTARTRSASHNLSGRISGACARDSKLISPPSAYPPRWFCEYKRCNTNGRKLTHL